MKPVWEKLFAGRAASTEASQGCGERHELETESPRASDEDRRLNSENSVCNFDSIGRRNESLRAQLDSIEFSFQNIEAIKAQFHNAVTSIDQILGETEHTNIAKLEAERKLASVSALYERLKGDHSELNVERDALTSEQDKLLARVADLERIVAAAEAASSEARSALADEHAKLMQMERELEENRSGRNAANEQLSAFRGEFVARESRLQEVERQRVALNDHCDLLQQENATLRTRVEEFVVNASKLGRQFTDLKDQRDQLQRRLKEVEISFGQERAAHVALKAGHLDAIEAQRLSEANLQEKYTATTARLEAAERLLAEARVGLHEQDSALREFERQALDKSLAAKSLETQIADLEKNLASAQAVRVDVEAARADAVEQSAILANSLGDKEAALQRAEQKIAALEANAGENKRATIGERAWFEERIASLTEQLEAQSAARLLAEGALHAARQERSMHRPDGGEVVASFNDGLSANEAISANSDSAQGKILRLRR